MRQGRQREVRRQRPCEMATCRGGCMRGVCVCIELMTRWVSKNGNREGCRAGRRGLGYVLTKRGIVVLSFILTALDAAAQIGHPFLVLQPSLVPNQVYSPSPPPVYTASYAKDPSILLPKTCRQLPPHERHSFAPSSLGLFADLHRRPSRPSVLSLSPWFDRHGRRLDQSALLSSTSPHPARANCR